MPFYKVCSFCGAHLDPDEKCDCQKARVEGTQLKKALKRKSSRRAERTVFDGRSKGILPRNFL